MKRVHIKAASYGYGVTDGFTYGDHLVAHYICNTLAIVEQMLASLSEAAAFRALGNAEREGAAIGSALGLAHTLVDTGADPCIVHDIMTAALAVRYVLVGVTQ